LIKKLIPMIALVFMVCVGYANAQMEITSVTAAPRSMLAADKSVPIETPEVYVSGPYLSFAGGSQVVAVSLDVISSGQYKPTVDVLVDGSDIGDIILGRTIVQSTEGPSLVRQKPGRSAILDLSMAGTYSVELRFALAGTPYHLPFAQQVEIKPFLSGGWICGEQENIFLTIRGVYPHGSYGAPEIVYFTNLQSGATLSRYISNVSYNEMVADAQLILSREEYNSLVEGGSSMVQVLMVDGNTSPLSWYSLPTDVPVSSSCTSTQKG
jgi:hypothetical protein